MKFFDWIKDILGLIDDDDDEFDFSLTMREEDDAESLAQALRYQSSSRREMNVHNYKDRERFVRNVCEKMTAGSVDVDQKKSEYQKVTDRLQDLEEIESLPSGDRATLRHLAQAIIDYEAKEAKYKRPESKISELQYREMESIEAELPEILKKLEESEKYQATVRRDMNLLEGEKAALAYQRKEDKGRLSNARSLFVVCVFAAIMAVGVILALASMMYTDYKLPITIVAAILAICLTGIFVSYRNARDSYRRTSRQINRSISLQNTAKIKYVNVTNLIDYYYSKYKINSSHELYYRWEKYEEEKKARHHSENSAEQLEALRNDLHSFLKRFRIKDPSAWVYQPSILVQDKEIAQLRHDLVIQRQRLRKGIDFEMYNLENGRKEIEDMVKQYPQYSKEIMALVDQYE